MVTMLLIPLSFALPYTSPALQRVGIDQAAADLAARYMMTFMPGLFLNSIADALDIFLLGMGKTYIILWMQLAVIPFHVLFCYLFIHVLDYGVIGAANAHNMTAILTFLI